MLERTLDLTDGLSFMPKGTKKKNKQKKRPVLMTE